ncbi:MAG: histidine kinase dimerization/phospho-acceptor domain-containing protein [bacterium]
MHPSIKKSTLKKEVQILKKQFNILYQISKSINSTLDLETLFWNIYKLVGKVIPTDAFYIGLCKDNTKYLDLLFIIDENKRYPRIVEPLENVLASQAIFKKETILLNGIEEEINSVKPDVLNTFSHNSKISKSIIISPIIVRDQVVGVMSTQSYNLNVYTAEDAKLLSLISTQAGVALENSQLYQHIKLERDKLDAILTHLGEGVNIIDVQFNIQFANRWIADRYGKNLRGNRCYKTFFGFKNPCRGCPLNREYKKIEEASFEIQTKKDKVFLVTVTPFKGIGIGGNGRILEIIRDITEKKNYEEELIQKEKLQSVIELAGAVGHELNQPLTGITGYCALIKEELQKEHPLYKDITEIEKQAGRLEMLVNKFQNIARVESQGYSGNNKILDLHKSSQVHKNINYDRRTS